MEVVLLLAALVGIALIAVPRLRRRRAGAARRVASAKRARASAPRRAAKARRSRTVAAAAPSPIATWTPAPPAAAAPASPAADQWDEEGWDDDLGWEGEDSRSAPNREAWQRWRSTESPLAPGGESSAVPEPSNGQLPSVERWREREPAAGEESDWLDDDGLGWEGEAAAPEPLTPPLPEAADAAPTEQWTRGNGHAALTGDGHGPLDAAAPSGNGHAPLDAAAPGGNGHAPHDGAGAPAGNGDGPADAAALAGDGHAPRDNTAPAGDGHAPRDNSAPAGNGHGPRDIGHAPPDDDPPADDWTLGNGRAPLNAPPAGNGHTPIDSRDWTRAGAAPIPAPVRENGRIRGRRGAALTPERSMPAVAASAAASTSAHAAAAVSGQVDWLDDEGDDWSPVAEPAGHAWGANGNGTGSPVPAAAPAPRGRRRIHPVLLVAIYAAAGIGAVVLASTVLLGGSKPAPAKHKTQTTVRATPTATATPAVTATPSATPDDAAAARAEAAAKAQSAFARDHAAARRTERAQEAKAATAARKAAARAKAKAARAADARNRSAGGTASGAGTPIAPTATPQYVPPAASPRSGGGGHSSGGGSCEFCIG